ncbi:hypothetical protein IFM89_027935 [Coptis chinensis]|uniref:Early flowering 3 n=1 Tax=Coptis chinensis TaxID=261450 RepID=A0A835IE82_9MAGN|nr:hypothetical protein IFM89_027935 [Coptis chinensis]
MSESLERLCSYKMKGGKDEDKNTGPMFPRLHVNDTEKGGPRAPPRNKMALYEQLSIPSQRSASTLPTGHNTAPGPLPPVASLSQGAGNARSVFPPFYIPPSAPAHSDDNHNLHSSDGMHLRTKANKCESTSMKPTNYRTSNTSVRPLSTSECGSFPLSNSKKYILNNLGIDNDFSVPTFVDPGNTLCSTKDQHNVDKERLHPSCSTETSGNSAQKASSPICNSSTHLHSARDKHLKRTNTTDLWSRQHVRNHCKDNPLESLLSMDCAERSSSNPFTREKNVEPSKHAYVSPDQEHRSSPLDDLQGLRDKNNNGNSQQEYRAGILTENISCGDGILVEPMYPLGKGEVLPMRNEFHSRASVGNGRESCNEFREDQIHGMLQVADVDRNDDASETSMVDSIAGFDISPDDVVGVIGQKHFWKARREIVSQQRLFAVQVFELHRLMKVQKLIAGSPHLLLEDTAYLTKSPVKASPPKKLSSEYMLESPPQIVKQKAVPQKPKQSTECAGENAGVKPLLPSVTDSVNRELVNQQSSHGPYHGSPALPSATDNNKIGWSFPAPPQNQWLVPVMSPSEGLVYKPYAGPCPPAAGFVAPIYGGCGPMGLPSMGGEFPSPYGIQASHHQGIGVLPCAPPLAQPFFSPYGMPIMNPVMSASSIEHMNHFTGSLSHGQAEHFSTGQGNFNTHSRTSRNISNQKSEAISSSFPKFQKIKESEVQGSTASSPGGKTREERAGKVSEGRDALPLFPMATAAENPNEPLQTQNIDQQHTRVIKVVPHNRRSATESAARIFQSIQEGRHQCD